MKIRKLRNKNINKNKWDECINNSLNRRIYAYSWYIDIVSSQKWDALVCDDYKAVMPLPFIRKAGVKIYLQPWFCQQLGIFYNEIMSKQEYLKFLSKIPSKFYLLNLNNGLSELFEYPNIYRNTNMVLALNKPYNEIKSSFSSNHKRNIKKSEKNELIFNDIKLEDYIRLKINSGAEIPSSKLEILRKLLFYLDKHDLIIKSAAYKNDIPLSAVIWLKDHKRFVYFQAALDKSGKETGAGFFIVNEMIKKYSKSDFSIDFEGSGFEGVKRFYSGFGAVNEDYPAIKSRLMKKIKEVRQNES